MYREQYGEYMHIDFVLLTTLNMSLPWSSNALLSSLLILLDTLTTFLQENFDDIFVSSSQWRSMKL